MTPPISNLSVLLSSMEPVLNAGVYAYVCLPYGTDLAPIPTLATMQEQEGITLIVTEAQALQSAWAVLFRCAWITLNVHSDLNAVGLTAAFARALGEAGISCNVVAGAYHDHLFVPVESAAPAMTALKNLQNQGAIG
jgi:hypothetical protein